VAAGDGLSIGGGMGPIGAVLRVRGLYVSEEDYEALRESIDTCVAVAVWLFADAVAVC
jgi:hypothetical protein